MQSHRTPSWFCRTCTPSGVISVPKPSRTPRRPSSTSMPARENHPTEDSTAVRIRAADAGVGALPVPVTVYAGGSGVAGVAAPVNHSATKPASAAQAPSGANRARRRWAKRNVQTRRFGSSNHSARRLASASSSSVTGSCRCAITLVAYCSRGGSLARSVFGRGTVRVPLWSSRMSPTAMPAVLSDSEQATSRSNRVLAGSCSSSTWPMPRQYAANTRTPARIRASISARAAAGSAVGASASPPRTAIPRASARVPGPISPGARR